MSEAERYGFFSKPKNRENIASVSPDIPLLANLSAEENISLVRHYHDKKRGQPLPPTRDLMMKLGLHDKADTAPSHLDEQDSFKVKLLRAVMLPDAVIGIDRPFLLLSGLYNITPVLEILEELKDYIRQCTFFDYEGNRKRYGDLIE